MASSRRITPRTAHEQIREGTPDAVYVIVGDDEHEKLELAAEFDRLVEEELRAFNVERFHGGDVSLGAVLDAARTLPMMAPRRLVVVTHAERVLEPSRDTQAANRDAEAMLEFVAEPPDHVVLVLVAANLDARRKLTKRLISAATVVQCGVLETVADAARWIRAAGKATGTAFSPAAVRALSERVGPDMGRLRGEVDRLMLFAADRDEVTEEDVREISGPVAAHDDWAVANAIERGQTSVALRELGKTLESGAVPYMVLGQLGWLARTKIPTARVPNAIDAVFRTDLALKRSAGDPRVLLERLVVDLCGSAGGRGPGLRRG